MLRHEQRLGPASPPDSRSLHTRMVMSGADCSTASACMTVVRYCDYITSDCIISEYTISDYRISGCALHCSCKVTLWARKTKTSRLVTVGYHLFTRSNCSKSMLHDIAHCKSQHKAHWAQQAASRSNLPLCQHRHTSPPPRVVHRVGGTSCAPPPPGYIDRVCPSAPLKLREPRGP
jgi:hypothetical protein